LIAEIDVESSIINHMVESCKTASE
jgi:hypothetical protein